MENKITREQINEWKKKHGETFKLKVDSRVAILKTPDRKTLSYGLCD